MMLTHEDVQEILRLVDATALQELELETERFKLILRRAGGGQNGWTQEQETRARAVAVPPAAAQSTAMPVLGAPPAAPARADLIEICAPLVGTFYRAPQPGAAPFVEVGSEVGPGKIVAIVETMKLMNSVPAATTGRVVQICAEDGQLVEQHQVIMRLAPLGA